MAITSGTYISSEITKGPSSAGNLQIAEVFFSMSGTYDQSANSQLQGVGASIAASRRNGRAVTIRGVMLGPPATKLSNAATMALKNIALSGDDITFTLTDGDYSTQLAAGAIPAQSTPFSILVALTEN